MHTHTHIYTHKAHIYTHPDIIKFIPNVSMPTIYKYINKQNISPEFVIEEMCGFISIKKLTFLYVIILLLMWCSYMESCNARSVRRGDNKASLSKKKGTHPINHDSHGDKKGNSHPKPPPPENPSPPPSSHPAEPPQPTAPPLQNAVFNVLDYGAKGDGSTDDTKAFEAAWYDACKIEASIINVPSDYTFLVGPISFSGPHCEKDIIFQLDGTIIAPTSSSPWGSGILQWLEFTKLVGLTIKGSGVIDGNGDVWWRNTPIDFDPTDDESKLMVPLNNTLSSSHGGGMPRIKPTALRFYGSFNVSVSGITIQNSQQFHLKFDSCEGVSVYNFTVSSPGDSPNTDGIHLQNSKDVLIRTSNLRCGDDCISIQTGCSNVYIHDINCGPGHGISIGSLGKDNTKACVSNITVRDVVMYNTMNGVRIKTWQGGSGSVQGIEFSNIEVAEVQFPIMIDQYYCDNGSSCKNQTSAVALSGIRYESIRGTYTVKPVHLACSDDVPCKDVTLDNVQLRPIQERYRLYDPYCWQAFGQLDTPTMPPVDCLQFGNPSSSNQGDNNDLCT